jgi:hypothetical protein
MKKILKMVKLGVFFECLDTIIDRVKTKNVYVPLHPPPPIREFQRQFRRNK